MKNHMANAALGIGIALLIVGIIFIGISPILGFLVGLVPVILGILALNKLKKDPSAGGKVKSIIGIVIGALLSLYSLYVLIFIL